MATFVLVHGACVGGWNWKKVTPLLRAAGHEVYTPTLTGLGERSHLLHPAIDLDTHIQDIVNVLELEDLVEVTLLGHSYGGMVITGVSDHVPERLSQLIHLDTDVPVDGQSLFDLWTAEECAEIQEQARTQGEGWHWMPPLAGFSDFSRSRARPHPIQTFAQPVHFKNPPSLSVPRTYILCTRGKVGHQQGADKALSEPGWRYRELDADHGANVSAPRELTDLLLHLV